MNKKRAKTLVIFSCIIAIMMLWYFEKIRRIPQYGIIFYELGLQCKDACDQSRQLRYFQKAIYHNPQLSAAYYQSALIYQEMEDETKSLEFFIKAAEYDQENVLAYYNLGLYYFNNGSYEQALRYFLKSSRKGSPSDIPYYLARIYDQKKEYLFAISRYHNAVLDNAQYVDEVYPRLVELYRLLNKENDLIWMIRRLKTINRPDLADRLQQCFDEAK